MKDKKSLNRQKAIIIGSADVIKLCTIRAVGSFGCDIDVVHIGSNKRVIKPVDYYSKYVGNYYFCYKSQVVQLLLDKCTCNYTKPVIITLDDYSTYLIDDARDELKSHFLFSHLSNNEPIVEMMNKHLLKMKAAQAGMNVVKGWPILFKDGVYQIPEDVTYPCFVKGLESTYMSKDIQCVCNSENELNNVLETCKKKYCHSVYAEEYIQIEKDFGVIGVSNGSNCVIPARADLLEMGKGSTNGVSMLGKISSFVDETLFGQIKSLVLDLNYVGIFNIDFVESKGRVYFVELNFRFAAYGYAIYCAGCNIPGLFINTLTHSDMKMIQTTIEGSYYYFNEKIGLINVIERSISLSKYKELRKKAIFPMIMKKQDPKPYRMFLLLNVIRFFKTIRNKYI